MQLLLVEDNRQLVELLTVSLTKAGFSVSVAESAGQAHDRLAQGRFDILVVDLGLPDADTDSPASVAAAGRAAGVRVIICSAAGRGTDELAERIDADAYLAKPFDIEDLVATVRRLLE